MARFSKKGTENKMCVQIFSTTFVCNISDFKNMINMYIGPHVKIPVFLSDFNET
jgi:hypothetical protein